MPSTKNSWLISRKFWEIMFHTLQFISWNQFLIRLTGWTPFSRNFSSMNSYLKSIVSKSQFEIVSDSFDYYYFWKIFSWIHETKIWDSNLLGHLWAFGLSNTRKFDRFRRRHHFRQFDDFFRQNGWFPSIWAELWWLVFGFFDHFLARKCLHL